MRTNMKNRRKRSSKLETVVRFTVCHPSGINRFTIPLSELGRMVEKLRFERAQLDPDDPDFPVWFHHSCDQINRRDFRVFSRFDPEGDVYDER